MSLFKLIRAFQKAKGRSPTPGELSQLKKQADAVPQPSNVLPFQFKKGFGDEINEMIERGDISIGTAPKTTKKKPMVDPKFEKAVKAQEERSESFAKFKERMDDKNKEGAFQIAFNRYKDVDKIAMPMSKVLSIYKNLAKYPKGRNVITQDIDDIQKGFMFSTMGNRSRQALVKDLQDILYPKKQSNPFEEVKVSDQLEFNFDDLDPKGMAGGGLAYMLGEGGRIGFAAGGIDKARRAFLKLMGGVGAGIGGLKMGLFGGKKTSTAIKVAETVKKSDAKGMPEWFPKLVEKVMKEGEDVTDTYSTVERTVVKKAKLPESKTDVIVEVDLTTGDTLVDVGMGRHGWVDGHNGQPVRIELRKGNVIEEGPARGKKEADEFGVEEQEYTGDGENVKYEDSSYNNYGEHGSDFSEVEKYATGKNTDEFNIKGTKKRENAVFAEGRAEMEAQEAFEEMDEFASGGLAKLLGE